MKTLAILMCLASAEPDCVTPKTDTQEQRDQLAEKVRDMRGDLGRGKL